MHFHPLPTEPHHSQTHSQPLAMYKLVAIASLLATLATATPRHPSFPSTPKYRDLAALLKRQNDYDQYTEAGNPYPGEQPREGDLRSRIPLICREDCYWPSSVYR
jgi:hypothetical protein